MSQMKNGFRKKLSESIDYYFIQKGLELQKINFHV